MLWRDCAARRATLEDASFGGLQGIDRSALMSLALSTWNERGETVCLAGAPGLGKTWLACALARYAYRQGRSSTTYVGWPGLN
jgi:DNA replication protein DnaC